MWTVGLLVVRKLRFWNFSSLKPVLEKLRFRDGLLWTVSLTVEIKLRFRDGLVWTEDLTVEMKLRFQISPRSVKEA